MANLTSPASIKKATYIKKWRSANPDKVHTYVSRYSSRIRKERRELVDNIKLKSGCVDCGYNKAPEALQFDHVDPKHKDKHVGALLMKPINRLMAEIDKCVVRCANCHAIKTKRLKEYLKKVA